jgi:hypothetical protein
VEEKVYCCNCIHFRDNPEACHADKNCRENHRSRMGVRILPPALINKKNDCPWYREQPEVTRIKRRILRKEKRR